MKIDYYEGRHQLETSVISGVILLSILVFFMIEKYLHWYHCHCHGIHEKYTKKTVGYINLIGKGIHNNWQSIWLILGILIIYLITNLALHGH